MKYKAYAVGLDGTKLTRRQRKAARREVFTSNKALHSRRAKNAAKEKAQ